MEYISIQHILNMIENLIITSTGATEMCGPLITANSNSSEQCAACCNVTPFV
jgi:hypothetical protein